MISSYKQFFVCSLVLFVSMIGISRAFWRGAGGSSITQKVILNNNNNKQSTMKRFMGSIQPLLANDLKAILKGAERKNYQIVDVREKDELELARLPDNNVINLPLSEAGTWTNEILEGEILDKSKPTICLCHHGVRSMRFANFIGKSAASQLIG